MRLVPTTSEICDLSNLTSESLQHSTPATAQPSACTKPEKTITINPVDYLVRTREELEDNRSLRRTVKAAFNSLKTVMEELDLQHGRLKQLEHDLTTRLS